MQSFASSFCSVRRQAVFNIAWLIISLLVCSGAARAQATPDTSLNQVIPDSARAEQARVRSLRNDAAGSTYTPQSWQPNPKKAGLYSAMLPGAGQFYNKQYWKIPIIYAGVAVSGYFFFQNRDKYQTYRRAYISRIDNDPGTRDEFEDIYTTGSLQQLQDGYKRYLDLTVLFTTLGYTIQVLDAVAFAHLRNFDISPDLSLHYGPVINPNGSLGIGIAAHF